MALRIPENEEQLHDWARNLVEDAGDMRRGHENEWWENLCTYAGDMWTEWNPHNRRLEEPPKPDHRVRLGVNLIQPVVRTEYAKLLKNRPITECVARSGDKTDMEAAEIGDKILNNYIEHQFQMPVIRREALMWTLTTGLGAIFIDYDDTAMGESEVLIDPQGNPIFDPAQIKAVQRYYRDKHRAPKTRAIPQGDFRIRALGPMQWGWDFSTFNPHEAAWCFVSETYDVEEVRRRWGVDVDPADGVSPNLLEQRVLEKVDLTGMIKGSTVKPTAQDLVVVTRVFVLPGRYRYFPDGAEIIFTDAELIDATKYPLGHEQLPISSMAHIPFPGSRYPLSIISQIKEPVLEISRTESQLLENRNMMGNPPWVKYDYHKIPDDELVNKPGLQLTIPFRPNGSDPHPIEMPEMPMYIREQGDRLREDVQTISGQGETSQGRVPPGARSGVAIAYLQEEDDTKLGPTVLAFEEMIQRASWQILRLMAERYDVPRTARIPRKHSEPEVFDFIGTMLAGVATVQVQAGSALPRSKAAKQQFILDLFSLGIETDPRKVKEMLELGEGDPEEWEKDMDQAERENTRMERTGQQSPVKDWFNHQAHMLVHRKFMKSADFEALPEQVQEAFEQHDILHQRYLTGVAEAQAQGVPVPGQSVPMVEGVGAQPQPGQSQGGATSEAPSTNTMPQ